MQIGKTPSRDNINYYKNGKNLWVSVRDLDNCVINNTKEKITDLGVKESNSKQIKKGDVLISYKLSLGKKAIVGEDLYTNEAICAFNTKNIDTMSNKFLYYAIDDIDLKNYTSGIIGNGSLNKQKLCNIKIPVPSLEKQKEVVEYCESLEKELDLTDFIKVCNIKLVNLILQKKYEDIEQFKTLYEAIKLNEKFTIKDEWIESKCGWTPFNGTTVDVTPYGTIINGKTTVWNQELIEKGFGKPYSFN